MNIKIPKSVTKEQRLLKLSISVTVFLSLSSIIFGLWAKSSSITFDGFYSLTDAVITYVSLIAAKMIMSGENERFQYGAWHFEPLLIFINGIVLGITCIYAFTDGLTGLFSEGRLIQFGIGSVFVAFSLIISMGMYFYISKSAKKVNSELLKVDARSWLIGGVLSGALLLSFTIGALIGDSPFTPYIDPLVLTITSLALLPFPLLSLVSAGKEILQIAPPDVSEKVNKIAEDIAYEYGFIEYKSHVSKVGRQMFIEIGLVSSSGEVTKSFGELDEIRAKIASRMGGLGPGYWLTVDFTSDHRWI